MNKLKKIASTPKKITLHVYERRGRYGLAAGFIAGCIALDRHTNSSFAELVDFLKEHDLLEEYTETHPVIVK